MKKNSLLDKDFLKALDKENQREIFVKIASLTFDENPIEFITGRATGGSINIDGNSSVRRTCSITLVAKELNIHDFYWGLNTKIQLFIGLQNRINPEYDNVIWFNQGIFLITDFSTNQTTSNYTISISGRDKMALLNGDIGGTIQSLTADFGKIEEYDEDGNLTISSIPLKDIVREVVHEYAREPFQNIIIEDLDDIGLELMEYRGEEPMYFLVNTNTNEVSNMFMDITGKSYRYSDNEIDTTNRNFSNDYITLDDERFVYDTRTEFYDNQTYPTHIIDELGNIYTVIKCVYGEAIGYRETDLTYAGELIGNVSNSIVQSCLDPIKKMLGNYEYFYDLEGKFHFRRKRTFIDVSWNNLVKDEENGGIYAESTALTSPVIYSFENANLITSFQNKPQFSSLKNDYSIWGTKKTISGNEYPVHLRYAIDKKPKYYKTIDGHIYSTMKKTTMEIYQEVREEAQLEYNAMITNHKKAPLPQGLSNDWWQMEDWANLYMEMTGFTEMPNEWLDNYITGEGDCLDLMTLFPNGHYYWDKNRTDLHIFDVDITEDGNLNGPLRSAVHNPSCSHTYTSYFLNNAKKNHFVSYIYKPKFPESVQVVIDQNMIIKAANKRHYNCEWREIIYQMAKDYLKHEHDQDFLSAVAENNPDYYPSGYTGYEMYYTDMVSFWRDLYNPEYEYTLVQTEIDKRLYDAEPEKYYFYRQCSDKIAFINNETYYTKISYDEFKKVKSLTLAQYEAEPKKYYYFTYGKSEIPFDSNTVYYIKTYDDYERQKYIAIPVKNQQELQGKDKSQVYYNLSNGKYYWCQNTTTFTEADTSQLNYNTEFGWNKDILNNPTGVNFWFNFLDSTDGSLTAYNVRNIGDRPKSINDTNVKAIYYRDTPTVVFLSSNLDETEKRRQRNLKPGYTFIYIPDYMMPLFTISTQKKDAKTVLEEWLYEYTNCTQSITINALPVYYLEPNTRIFIYDENSGINGEYIINKISYQLTYNSTMNIQATKAIDRIY